MAGSKKAKMDVEDPIEESVEEDETSKKEPYLALYRRFRPAQFADVLGQEGVTEVLSRTIVDKKIAHAYLFTGPRGCGKTTTARILAAAINCENLGKDGEPCQKCDSCFGVANGLQGLGVVEYDAASNRSVDGIRAIIDQTRTSSALSKHKVFIIDEIHALTNDAVTALLKTLEEPPPGVIFILCTTEVQKVLPTIKSRTVHFRFNLVEPETMGKLIGIVSEQAGIEITAKQLRNVVSEGKGSPRDTLSALERIALGGVSTESNYPSDVTIAIAHASVSDIITIVAEAIAKGVDLAAFGYDLITYWRDCILALQAPALLRVSDERLDEILEDANAVKLSRLFRMVPEVSEAIGKMAYSGDPRILLETTLIGLILPDLAQRSYVGIQNQLEEMRADIAVIASALRSGSGLTTTVWPEVGDAEAPSRAAESTPVEKGEPVEEEPVKESKSSKKSSETKDELEPEQESDSDDDDLEPEAILDAMIEDSSKRLRLILEDATIIENKCTDKLFALETKHVNDEVFATIESLVKKHAGGRKLKYYER